MLEATCYILDGKKVVPCADIERWQRFMNDLPGRTVSSQQAGKFGVHTTFVGVNLGSEFMPKFFRTIISGDNGQNDPYLSETWEQAEKKHNAVVENSLSLTRAANKKAKGQASGAKVVDYSILPDGELRFVLESEADAIKLVLPTYKNWSRNGKTIIFHPNRRKNQLQM